MGGCVNRLLGVTTAFGVLAAASGAWAAAPAEAIRFAPHRAVYDITLERASSGSGVVELTGRMVYELQGSRCEGFTQNMRFVTQIISQDGTEQLNDLRTSSWEDGAGQRLRFNSEQYRDSKLVETTTGDARRGVPNGDLTVGITKPEKAQVNFPGRYLFPMQHSEALLQSARHGKRQFAVGIYDGSDKGVKTYETSAWIGAPRTFLLTGEPPGLKGLPSWPVTVAYFDPAGEAGDGLPSYELSYRIFANGVSTNMAIDYGDFAVRGQLSELTLYAPSSCTEPVAKGASR